MLSPRPDVSLQRDRVTAEPLRVSADLEGLHKMNAMNGLSRSQRCFKHFRRNLSCDAVDDERVDGADFFVFRSLSSLLIQWSFTTRNVSEG